MWRTIAAPDGPVLAGDLVSPEHRLCVVYNICDSECSARPLSCLWPARPPLSICQASHLFTPLSLSLSFPWQLAVSASLNVRWLSFAGVISKSCYIRSRWGNSQKQRGKRSAICQLRLTHTFNWAGGQDSRVQHETFDRLSISLTFDWNEHVVVSEYLSPIKWRRSP